MMFDVVYSDVSGSSTKVPNLGCICLYEFNVSSGEIYHLFPNIYTYISEYYFI